MKILLISTLSLLCSQIALSRDLSEKEQLEIVDVYDFVDQGQDTINEQKDSERLKEQLESSYTSSIFFQSCNAFEKEINGLSCQNIYQEQIVDNSDWFLKSRIESGSDVLYTFLKEITLKEGVNCQVELGIEFQDFDGKLLSVHDKLHVLCG